jgi:hypothetical protein
MTRNDGTYPPINGGEGAWRLAEYPIWYQMIARCERKHRAFKNYGGRGIKVCRKWRDSFWVFLEDMGPRPNGMELDRIDNNGNYEPTNCRWTTIVQQANNRRNNRLFTANGETRSLKEWSSILGIQYSTLQLRISRGMPLEQALNQPLRSSSFEKPEAQEVLRRLRAGEKRSEIADSMRLSRAWVGQIGHYYGLRARPFKPRPQTRKDE